MADLSMRRNEHCVIGLPACEYVFNSSRSCFIAYGFRTSPLEVQILTSILNDHQMEVNEAGGSLAAGSLAFCTKICSKIITSQFCIVLLNNDLEDGRLVANANVNMEYGLMLGFNKYVIPFQNEAHLLPFNTQGLDTVKYNVSNFASKAKQAIEKAIADTAPRRDVSPPLDQLVRSFLMSRGAFITPISSPGDQLISGIIGGLGMNLCNVLHGQHYVFLGVYTHLRAEVIARRIEKVPDILRFLVDNFNQRHKAGMIAVADPRAVLDIIKQTEVWVIVSGQRERDFLAGHQQSHPLPLALQTFSLDDVSADLAKSALF